MTTSRSALASICVPAMLLVGCSSNPTTTSQDPSPTSVTTPSAADTVADNTPSNAENTATSPMSSGASSQPQPKQTHQHQDPTARGEGVIDLTARQGKVVDITGALLSSTNPSCAAYVGKTTSNVTNVRNNSRHIGTVTISTDGAKCFFQSNQIPHHDMGRNGAFANEAGEVQLSVSVPVVPTRAAQPTPLGLGASAIMLNGVKWESYPAACFGEGRGRPGREKIGCGPDQIDNPWRYNVGSAFNNFGFDDHHAHVQPGGLYHYHTTPNVLFDQRCDEKQHVSPVVGFAADGFPIYGPCFTAADGTIRKAVSGYALKRGERKDVPGYTTPYKVGGVVSSEYNGQFIGDYEWSSEHGDLDECNGMEVDGQYGYRITDDYPYVIACIRGVPSRDFR